jgi:hypothetical protein
MTVLVASISACTTLPQANALVLSTPPSEARPAHTLQVSAQDAPLQLLKIAPDTGHVGDSFIITGEGLPPGKPVEFVWVTANGSYVTQTSAENVEFYNKRFEEQRLSLGQATTDAQGRVTVSFTTPEDYGEVHDIYALVAGQDVAKGGYRILRDVTISPTEGALGTPIIIRVTGLGWRTYESTIAVRYDNSYTGIMTAVTTRGTATAVIRAAGPVGKRVIDINHGAKSIPYLNNQQSGTAHIPDFRFWFTVTEDAGPPPVVFDWPDASRLIAATDIQTRTASDGAPTAPGVSAVLEPASGPILSEPTLRASGLSANAEVTVFWMTARGNRVGPRGWHLEETQMLAATADQNGELSTTLSIPDDLGGWHAVKLVQGDQVMIEIPYFIEHSLIGVTPLRVKAGEIFTVQIKGVGWTELDNGVAVTYDNNFIGFACGFNSNGDVTMNLVATGSPGTHLIDLYPMIYQGHGEPPWGYQTPFLTYKDDFPGLPLGYKLPAIRLAIEVIE